MDERNLGRAGPRVSVLGLGGSPLGGGLFQGREAAMVDLVRAALDAGVTFIDTSSNYGMGRSEAIIGRALRGRRDSVTVATKGGAMFSSTARLALAARPVLRPLRAAFRPLRRQLNLARDAHKRYDYSAAGLRRALEASLRRLGTDHIDVYQLYNPTADSPGLDTAIETLERFRTEGKARLVGLSVNRVVDAEPLLARWRPDTLQLPVSLLDPQACATLLPRLQRDGIGVIARSIMGQGLLTDAAGHVMADESSHLTREELAARREQARGLRRFVRPDRTLAQTAVRFVMQQPAIATALFAATDLTQLRENLGAIEAPALDAGEIAALAAQSPSR